MNTDDIRADIASFADNEDSVEIDRGYVVFQRDRIDFECRLIEDSSGVLVEYAGGTLPYRKFLAEHLGRMSILAEALIEKRKDVSPYIDTRVLTTDSAGKSLAPNSGLKQLADECQSKILGETKLLFLTADAGHGKTALLRRLTRSLAESYLAGKSDRLLFHIDTQGRSFVRLEEAVARDLGQLRIFGLFYPGVLTLVKHGLVALAIDGFDELLAEIGVGEAYSGLGSLLRQLKGNGVVVASARSAYFEVENYAAQTRLLTSSPDTHVSVSQMRLERWERTESVTLFRQFRDASGAFIEDPEGLYDNLAEILGPDHPVLHRPFLVHRMAALIAPNIQVASELALDIGRSGLQVVPKVIQALLKREVEEKWRDQSGQPYLTVDQHIILLAAIADEMWSEGKNSLSADTIQLVSEAVIDDLGIPTSSRVQIVQRVRAHALLPVGNRNELSFDHEEFLNYFLAARLTHLMQTYDKYGFQRFCEAYPLPDSVVLWGANIQDWQPVQAHRIVEWISTICKNESRSSYLRQNSGSIVAQFAGRLELPATLAYRFESLYFEGDCWSASKLHASEFFRCTFVSVDLSDSKWSDCQFKECRVEGLIINEETKLPGCFFDEASTLVGVLRRKDGEDSSLKSYVPEECKALLFQIGVNFPVVIETVRALTPVPPEKRKALDAFFKIFARNTGANENMTKVKLGAKFGAFKKDTVPLLLRFNVIRTTPYFGGGQQERWELCFPIETILRAEDPSSSSPTHLREFWNTLRDR